MDALIRAFASDYDDVIVAADEGGVMDGSGGAPEDALWDSSD